jgi:hypothetical protein
MKSAMKIALVGLATVAIVLPIAAPGQAARAEARHGFAPPHPGAVEGRPDFDRRHDFDRFEHHPKGDDRAPVYGPWVYLGPGYPYGWSSPPADEYQASTGYAYYCPSAGGYYPYVPSCPEPWVPVPSGAPSTP